MMTADLFVAFFSFMMAIRVYNHVGYLINIWVTRRMPWSCRATVPNS